MEYKDKGSVTFMEYREKCEKADAALLRNIGEPNFINLVSPKMFFLRNVSNHLFAIS
jgi:hypothetical protein